MTNLPGWSIPIGSLVGCGDCHVAFSTAEKSCPKCGSELGLHPITNGEASAKIKALLDLIDEAEGVLLTLAKRRLGPSSLLAWRMVDRIRTQKQKAPAATGAPTNKEVMSYS